MCYSCIIFSAFFIMIIIHNQSYAILFLSEHSYQSIINLIIYMRRTCYSIILSSLLTHVLHAEGIALSIINKAMEWTVKQSMIWNSRIRNLHKAIDWIEKQSLGLRHEAIAWINGQSIGSNRLDSQAIDWKAIAWLVTKHLVGDQALGSSSPSLKQAVTGRITKIPYSSILIRF